MHLRKIKRRAGQQRKNSMRRKAKRVLFFCCFVLLASLVQAQPPRPHTPVRVDPAKDQLEYKGLTVQLIPTLGGYYGYDILRGKMLVRHQVKSPEPDHILTDKETAFKAAKWMADQYLRTGHCPHMLPPGLLNHHAPASSVTNQNHKK